MSSHLSRPDSSLLHTGLSPGQVASCLILVGPEHRARLFAERLEYCMTIRSERGPVTFTGTYQGTPVSVMSIGMGLAMMDFVLREVRSCIPLDRPLTVIRVGTCGCLKFDPQDRQCLGSVSIADRGACIIQTSFSDYGDRFQISPPFTPDPTLSKLLSEEFGTAAFSSFNMTADFFYSSQGRTSPGFNDNNAMLFSNILAKIPSEPRVTMEMETGYLFYAANKLCATPMRVAAVHIVVVDRRSEPGAFLEDDGRSIEPTVVQPVLDAIIKFLQA